MKAMSNTPGHTPRHSVANALDAALELIKSKGFNSSEHIGAGLILCGLLTLAFILECKDESETQ